MISKGLRGLFPLWLMSIVLLAQGADVRQRVDQSADVEEASQLHDQVLKLYSEGKYDEAIRLATRELKLRERWLSSDDLRVAESLQSLGMLYREMGDYLHAETAYQRALTIREKSLDGDDPRIATTLSHLGLLNRLKGDYQRAELEYKRSLAIREKTLGADDPFVATSLNNLAVVYSYLEDYSQAEALLQRALIIYEATVGPEDTYVATVLNNLAEIYWERGDLAQAEKLLKRSIVIDEKKLGLEHPEVAQSLTNLATVYADRGDVAQAEGLYQRALAIRERTLGPEHPLIASLLSNLSLLYRTQGETQRAIQSQTRANEVREHSMALMLSTGAESQKQRYLSVLAGETAGTISLQVNFAPDNPLAIRMAVLTVLQRKGRVLDAMSNQIASLRRNLKSEDLDQLQKSRGRLSALILRGIGAGGPEKYRVEITKLEAEIQGLEANASLRSNEHRSQSQPVTLEAVQRAIPADAAVVEFVTYRPFDPKAKTRKERWQAAHYVAYVLKRTGTPTWVELGDGETIDAQVRKLRAALRNRERADVEQLARALDLRVMQSLRGLLGNARHVFLSPDGMLNLVPFGALVDEHNHFLVEKYTFTYLTSARDLLRLDTYSKSRHESLVMASPAFNRALSVNDAESEALRSQDENRRPYDFQGNFQPLTGTLDEAREIGKLLGVRPRVEEQATETLLKAVSGPRILHIATHGFFLTRQNQKANATKTDPLGNFLLLPTTDERDNPLVRSGLALAGANQLRGGGFEDGVLTALEASGLDLWGTQLVVLSACESGLGDVQKGEGVYGLRRALVLAGASSQMVSLWKVNDEVTRDLMVKYYDRLLSGKQGRSEALRLVQREMIASKGKSTDLSHPYFWASFIQSGDWKNLERRDAK